MISKRFAYTFLAILILAIVSVMAILFTTLRLRAESDAFIFARNEPYLYHHQTVARPGATRSQFAARSAEEFSAPNLLYVGRVVPIFENMRDSEPKDEIYLHIVQVIEQRSYWKRVSATIGEIWIYAVLPQVSEILLDVPSFNQQQLGLRTGCEIVALAMVINKYVDVDVFTLVYEMPRSRDPLLGFRGDPFTRGGFTILPPALMELTERHIGSAKDMTGASIEEVQAQLARGRPVLVWLRGMFNFNVHVITLTGFNQYGFFYNDPWLGGVNVFISYEDFLAYWDDPIRDRILDRIYEPRIAMSY